MIYSKDKEQIRKKYLLIPNTSSKDKDEILLIRWIITAINKDYSLEILNDRTGNIKNFKVKDFKIIENENKLDDIYLTIKEFDSDKTQEFSLVNISEMIVKNSLRTQCRFEIYTPNGDYRLTFSK